MLKIELKGLSMSRTLADINDDNIRAYNTEHNTFEDFPIGTRVKIITPCEDFTFFNGETGTVIKNSGEYLGIRVKYDKPRRYKNGAIETDWSFNPQSLAILNERNIEIARKREEMTDEDFEIDISEEKRSERFRMMDL